MFLSSDFPNENLVDPSYKFLLDEWNSKNEDFGEYGLKDYFKEKPYYDYLELKNVLSGDLVDRAIGYVEKNSESRFYQKPSAAEIDKIVAGKLKQIDQNKKVILKDTE